MELTSVEQVSELVVGAWLLCGGTPSFGAPAAGEVGFELTADGRYSRVYDGPDDTLIRAEGLDQDGTWEVMEATATNGPGFYSLTLIRAGENYHRIGYFADPTSLVLTHTMGVAGYTLWTGAPPQPGLPPGTGAGGCGQVTGRVELTSVEQVSELVIGTWLLCDGTPSFGAPAVGEVGLQLTEDGRFYRVYDGPDDTLIRAEGLDQEGTWQLIDVFGSYQLNLTRTGTSPRKVSYYSSPTTLVLDHMMGSARYSLWTGAPPEPGLPPGVGTGGCGQVTGPVTPQSVAEATQLLLGTWLRCAGPAALGTTAPGEVGLQFTPDGRYHRVFSGDGGTVVQGSGSGQEGTWNLSDTTSMNGPGSYHLRLLKEPGFVSGALVFYSTPPFMRLVGMTGNSDYLRWSGTVVTRSDTPTTPPSAPAASPPSSRPTFNTGVSGYDGLPAAAVAGWVATVAAVAAISRRHGRWLTEPAT